MEAFHPWANVNRWRVDGSFDSFWVHEMALDFGLVPVTDDAWPEMSAGNLAAHVVWGRSSDSVEVDAILAGMNGWFSMVRAWVRFLITQPVDSELSSTSLVFEAEGLHLHGYDAERDGPITRMDRITVGASNTHMQALTRDQWETVLSLAARNVSMPDEFSLIADARMALLGYQYRLSLIQACTAIELLMQQLFESELSGLGEAAQAAILGENWTLGRLQKIVSKCGHVLPDALTQTVKARNAAIHRNSHPTKDEAEASIGVALLLASELFDLDVDPNDPLSVTAFRPS
ncbi:hypothetical protein [Aquihabitans sp. McL0605]|uniref:hypothetical protein n=1 Tax=Aquihabitans sp. McL0605 TaxID=3415671 RepID=UPI003CF466C4